MVTDYMWFIIHRYYYMNIILYYIYDPRIGAIGFSKNMLIMHVARLSNLICSNLYNYCCSKLKALYSQCKLYSNFLSITFVCKISHSFLLTEIFTEFYDSLIMSHCTCIASCLELVVGLSLMCWHNFENNIIGSNFSENNSGIIECL